MKTWKSQLKSRLLNLHYHLPLGTSYERYSIADALRVDITLIDICMLGSLPANQATIAPAQFE